MKTFYRLLINTLLANFTNNFVWFALIFWAYLGTGSVLMTSVVGGSYMLLSAFMGLFFGTFVDHQKKKAAMLYSSLISLAAFGGAAIIYGMTESSRLLSLGSGEFWVLTFLVLAGAVVGNMRNIALSTTVTLLVPEKQHDRANGLVGTATGLSFSLTSLFSGLAIGQLGMGWVLGITLVCTAAVTVHLLTIQVPEDEPAREEGAPKRLDIKGALAAVRQVPGLLALLFFATFNNFLGGVFMSLMDAYGLSLVSVELWGVLWAVVSLSFIAGGIFVARRGLGTSPLRTMFLANIVMWVVCILFPLRASIILLAIGMLVYMFLIPVVEASEHTIIQKVVPYRLQGRVFGFGQTLENAASPITSFLIGPIAQLWVIPFMSDGAGARSIGSWFGTGAARGMALIFMGAGVIGLIVTLLAMTSKPYQRLSDSYTADSIDPEAIPATPLA